MTRVDELFAVMRHTPVSVAPAADVHMRATRRRHRRVALVSALATSAVVTAVWLGSPPGRVADPVTSTDDGPLVASGDCAGVTMTMGPPAEPTRWRVTAGQNAITVSADSLTYLQPTGPCISALTYRTSGVVLQTLDASGNEGFIAHEPGGIVANVGGTQSVELWLGCAGRALPQCRDERLAIIAVTVTPQTATPTTAQPRRQP